MYTNTKHKAKMINVYFNCLIDTESHPEITNIKSKKEVLAIASKMTSNKITFIDWEQGDYMVFSEIITIDEKLPENIGYSLEAIIKELKPQCPDAEFSCTRKVKNKVKAD